MKNKNKSNKYKILLTSLNLLVFLIFAFAIVYSVYFYYKSTIQDLDELSKINFKESKQEKCEAVRKLDGVCVKKGQEDLWPVAIMIDNHPDARPQYGLSKAQLVYDTLVEGGTTRLMAVFATDEEIEKIGPVRSARPYYLTWAKGINALFGHSGGSPEALEKIKEYQIIDWEEATSYGPRYFWRSNGKFPPHNLYTSNEKIAAARIDWELFDKISNYRPWRFYKGISSTLEAADGIYSTLQSVPHASDGMNGQDPGTSFSKNSEAGSARVVYIDYSPGVLFDVEYKYNTSTQTYLRFQNNQPHIDGLNNKQIGVKNLIIQFVPEEIHLDAKDRLKIETLGQGKTWVFYHNKLIKGIWVKRSLKDRTVFYDENGKEVVFKPGNIWIEVVPGKRKVEVK